MKKYSQSLFNRHFTIRRCNLQLIQDIKLRWGYFFNHPESIKINIKNNNIYIHMNDDNAYCVILNFLNYINRKSGLECSKKDLEWLKTFDL